MSHSKMSDARRGTSKTPADEKTQSADANDAHPQSASPLFGLPAEVRLLIYEFVFGTRTIDFNFRSCRTDDNYLPSASGMVPRRVSGETHEMVGEFNKISYAVCQLPCDDWTRSYSLSKTDVAIPEDCIDADGNVRWGVASEHIRTPYWARHRSCFLPVYDFEQRNHTLMCKDGSIHPKPVDCEECHCRTRHTKILKVYGRHFRTQDGLRDLHAHNKLDLSILRTCRLIHHEACLLPYSLFLFEVQTDEVAAVLYKDVFTTRQAHAIEQVHINESVYQAESYQILLHCFPGLKQLRQSCDYAEVLDGSAKEWTEFFRLKRRSKLQAVEVVTNFDSDGSQEDRDGHRSQSEELERYLSSSYYAEAQPVFIVDNVSGDLTPIDADEFHGLCVAEENVKAPRHGVHHKLRRSGARKTTLREPFVWLDDDEDFSDSDHEISDDDEDGQLQRRHRMNFRRFNDEIHRRSKLREYKPYYKRRDVQVEYHRARQAL